METGLINAKNLLHNRTEYSTFKSQIEHDSDILAEEIELKAIALQREHSFKTTFEKKIFCLSYWKRTLGKMGLNSTENKIVKVFTRD